MKKINTIWIVDDDPIQIFIAKRILQKINFFENILTMDNGKKALDKLKDLPALQDKGFPDIIFLDINMPQMDGWQFLKEFEKMSLKKKINIYLLTSSIDPLDVKRAGTCESLSSYLTKPVKTENLQEIIKRFRDQ